MISALVQPRMVNTVSAMAPAAARCAAAAAARPALPPDRGVRRAVRIVEGKRRRSEPSPTRSRTPVGKRTGHDLAMFYTLGCLPGFPHRKTGSSR